MSGHPPSCFADVSHRHPWTRDRWNWFVNWPCSQTFHLGAAGWALRSSVWAFGAISRRRHPWLSLKVACDTCWLSSSFSLHFAFLRIEAAELCDSISKLSSALSFSWTSLQAPSTCESYQRIACRFPVFDWAVVSISYSWEQHFCHALLQSTQRKIVSDIACICLEAPHLVCILLENDWRKSRWGN